MTTQEAIRILTEQRNKFMDEWCDFGGVNEAYNMAISLLEKVVRCKDCMYGTLRTLPDGYPYVMCCGQDYPVEWYCADGVRR